MIAVQIAGVTEPWFYMGPGFAGMHQEDGMMDSYNISVPISLLPKTDKLLRKAGIDFMKACKVSIFDSRLGLVSTWM